MKPEFSTLYSDERGRVWRTPRLIFSACCCNLKSSSSASAQNSQVSGEAQSTGSVYGVGSGSKGNTVEGGGEAVSVGTVNKGGTVTVESLDPEVAEAALTAETITATQAQQSEAQQQAAENALTADALDDISGAESTNAQIAADSIAAQQETSQQSEQFVNENTALAFSTIDQLTEANTEGSAQAASDSQAAELNAANGYAVDSNGTPVSYTTPQNILQPVVSGGPTLATSGNSGLTNTYYFFGILAAIGALWYYVHTKKKA